MYLAYLGSQHGGWHGSLHGDFGARQVMADSGTVQSLPTRCIFAIQDIDTSAI